MGILREKDIGILALIFLKRKRGVRRREVLGKEREEGGTKSGKKEDLLN